MHVRTHPRSEAKHKQIKQCMQDWVYKEIYDVYIYVRTGDVHFTKGWGTTDRQISAGIN